MMMVIIGKDMIRSMRNGFKAVQEDPLSTFSIDVGRSFI
jgi:hypothetical protein